MNYNKKHKTNKGLGGRLEDVRTAYSFTGAVDTVQVDVNVGYGSSFIAKTVYTYNKGRKTRMKLSVSHGRPTQSRETEYAYDLVGRLGGKARQLTGTGRSTCSYSYDVHGWATGVTEGEFQERLYYADGLDGGCYNGNISTLKWKGAGDGGVYQGYNLEYDDANRLHGAVYGQGDNLNSYANYFNEHADYDCNGNITRLRRRGLVDNLHGGFGLVDNLHMTYEGNMLTSVCDSTSHLPYASATDFDGVPGQEYPLTYNGAGSLVSDAGHGMAHIGYDRLNNPVRIQFTNGSVTRYVYSAAGEKLRVIHQTAVPNISVPIGGTRELAPSQILYADTTDYLLGGSLTLRNGRIDKLQFEEGYCQAERYAYNADKDNITFYYYDCDHLGNVRQVTTATGSNKGTVVQRMDYYPFGAQLCGGSYDSNFQSHKYNGKELDKMHGLNTYDYGARQYNPILGRWDRMDPLCEKYYDVSPYAYCGNNPVRYIDPDGNSIIVTGKYTDEAINQIQSFVGNGLFLYYQDEFLCYTITNKDKLTKKAKLYIEMIDDPNIDIQISTIDNNQFMIGGAYLGHEVEKNENGDVVYVKAFQSIDPNVLAKADSYSEKGKMITHEITEAYEGAKIGKKTGKDDKLRIKNNKTQPFKTYEKAHFRATEQNVIQKRSICTPSGITNEYYVTNNKGEETVILTQ